MDTHEHVDLPDTSDGPPEANVDRLSWAFNLSAIVFNSCFAVLAVVTLCGIVFITRPKAVLHDVQPSHWLPLLIVMAPAQAYAQFLSWSTVCAGQNPTGPAIASRQRTFPWVLRPFVAVVWLCNFCIGFAIVVSLSKPNPGNPPGEGAALILVLGSWLAFAAVVYLLLAIRTLTPNPEHLRRVWAARTVIALAMGIFGAVYYELL